MLLSCVGSFLFGWFTIPEDRLHISQIDSGMGNHPKRKLCTPLNHSHDPDDEVGDFGGSLKIRVFHIIRLDPNIVEH